MEEDQQQQQQQQDCTTTTTTSTKKNAIKTTTTLLEAARNNDHLLRVVQQQQQQDSSTTKNDAKTTALEARNDHLLRVPYFCEENVWRLAYRKLTIQKHAEKDATNNNQQYKYFVAFISNANQTVVMLHQRASESPRQEVVCWDYHVILIRVKIPHVQQDDGVGAATEGATNDTDNSDNMDDNDDMEYDSTNIEVYDVDTLLQPYPCSLQDYLAHSFPSPAAYYNTDHGDDMQKYAPVFRLIPAQFFVQHFSSDRSHMYDSVAKKWKAPPPAYECIQQQQTPKVRKLSLTNTVDESTGSITTTTKLILMNNMPQYLDFKNTDSGLGDMLTLPQLIEYDFIHNDNDDSSSSEDGDDDMV